MATININENSSINEKNIGHVIKRYFLITFISIYVNKFIALIIKIL